MDLLVGVRTSPGIERLSMLSELRSVQITNHNILPFTEASKRSGLSVWIGKELGVLGSLPDWAMVVIVCILVNNDNNNIGE